jgi:Tfp pilus assembly protein PilF
MYSLLYHYSDDTKGAIRILRNATKRLKNSEDLSYCWGRIGDLYHELENDKEAFKAYRKALDYNPENVEVLNNYAYFLSLRNEQLDKALAMSSLAIVLEADNYNYIDTHAWVLHCLGRNDEAKRYMRQALMLSQHGEASLLAHYGDILWALGERFMAETYWQKAIDAGYDADEMAEHIAQLKQDK